MPIQFMCNNCRKTLQIARRKAGSQVQCPKCQRSVIVPFANSTPDKQTHVEDQAETRKNKRATRNPQEHSVSLIIESAASNGPSESAEAAKSSTQPTTTRDSKPPIIPAQVLERNSVSNSATEAISRPTSNGHPSRASSKPAFEGPVKSLEDMPLFENIALDPPSSEKITPIKVTEEKPASEQVLPQLPAYDAYVISRGLMSIFLITIVLLLSFAFLLGFLIGSW